jgi:hypothetical protein
MIVSFPASEISFGEQEYGLLTVSCMVVQILPETAGFPRILRGGH